MAQTMNAEVESPLEVVLGKIDFDPAELKTRYLSERDKRLRADGNEQYVEVLLFYLGFGLLAIIDTT